MRFRSKSYLYFDPDGQNPQRGLVVAIDAANAPVGECGVENQVGRVGVTFCANSITTTDATALHEPAKFEATKK